MPRGPATPVSVYRVVPFGHATVKATAFKVPSVDWQNVSDVMVVEAIGAAAVAP